MDIQVTGEECVELTCAGRRLEHQYGSEICSFKLAWINNEAVLVSKASNIMQKPNAAQRWDRWMEKHEDFVPDAPLDLDWARRGDGALMLQDEWGWFAMVTNGVGDTGAQSADPEDDDPEIYTVYCEPIWLAWAADREITRGEEHEA